jgi:hypothetical protein
LLTGDDWEILKQYVQLLQPCYHATIDLQGQVGDNKPSALFHVQSDIECILTRLTEAEARYKQAPVGSIEGEWHFGNQLRLARDKAEQYFAKLDDSPAYLASIVLHPGYTWKYINIQWQQQKNWLRTGRAALTALWQSDYAPNDAALATPATTNLSSPKKTRYRQDRRNLSTMEEYRQQALAQARGIQRPTTQDDELERWLDDQLAVDGNTAPLAWWRDNGKNYPRLTQMAVDLLSIPAMSDEPERLFSRLGLIITPRRNHIKQEAVQALCCLQSWDKSRLINLQNDPADI